MTQPGTVRPARFASALLALALLGLPPLSGCSRSANGKAGAGAGRPPVAVDTAQVAAADLEESIDVVGTLAAKNEVDVKSEYSGTIAEVFVTEWVRVTKGTPLARLDTREADAQNQAARAALLQAQVAAARAARELSRTEKMKEAGLATQQGLDEARTVREAAAASLEAAKAQLWAAETRLHKAVLLAPIDGVVSRRSANVGDYVENMGNPAPIFRIVDNRTLELTATVPSTRLASVKVGQPLAFTTDALPGREFQGRISYINPATEEGSRALRIRAEVPNPDEALKSGLFVKGRIVTGRRAGVLSVPRGALQTWDTARNLAAVFVVDGDVVKRRTIRTGAAPGDRVEVVEGLAAGDVVVTRGGFSLRDGDRVRTGAPEA